MKLKLSNKDRSKSGSSKGITILGRRKENAVIDSRESWVSMVRSGKEKQTEGDP